MKKTIIYTRVSTSEQADNGYSLRDQEDRLRQYCKIKDIVVVKHFEEDYSAKNFDRPQFKFLREYVKKHKREIDCLFFTKWDRFSRNAGAALNVLKEFSDMGVEVNAIEQPIDFSIPENKLMLAFYITSPEVENDRRSLNTKSGMRRAKKEGRWVSTPPMGYKFSRDEKNKPIIIPDIKADLITRLFKEYASGICTKEEVRKKYNRLGLNITKSHILRVLKNPVYIGKILIPEWQKEEEELVEGIHQPIVDETTFYKVQQLLNGNSKTYKPKKKNEHFPLRGYLKCNRCGGVLTGSGSKSKSGKRYYYYHCQKGCKERFRANEANDHFVDYLNELKPSKELSQLYFEIIKDTFNQEYEQTTEDRNKFDKEIDTLKVKIDGIEEKYINDIIDVTLYNKWKKKYGEDLRKLEANKKEFEMSKSEFERYLAFTQPLLLYIDKHYDEAPIEIKQNIVSSIFPEKLIYTNQNYRTPKVNELVKILSSNSNTFGTKEQQKREVCFNTSLMAARRGLKNTNLS